MCNIIRGRGRRSRRLRCTPRLALRFTKPAACKAGVEGLLDPRVAQPDLMFLAQLLMEMPHVQIEVLVPVQAQNLFRLRLRHAPSARCTAPTVQQALDRKSTRLNS